MKVLFRHQQTFDLILAAMGGLNLAQAVAPDHIIAMMVACAFFRVSLLPWEIKE